MKIHLYWFDSNFKYIKIFTMIELNKHTLTLIDFFFSLPEIFLILCSFILLIFNINYNSTKSIKDRITLLLPNYYLIIQILVISLLLLINISTDYNNNIILNELFHYNFFTLFFKILIILSSIFVLLISFQYVFEYKNIFTILKDKYEYSLISYEYLILIIFSIVGMLLVVSSYDIISLYLSLELQSISLYILATFRKNITSVEAGLKYFLIGSLASIFIIFGFSFLYGLTGLTNFTHLVYYTTNYSFLYNENSISLLLIFLSFLFIIIGLAIKLGVAPFHF